MTRTHFHYLYLKSLQQYTTIAKTNYDVYSEESFVSTISRALRGILNLLSRIINNFKGSILGLFRELKRTELQEFKDSYKFSVNRILSLNYSIIASFDTIIPKGMVKPYKVTTENIKTCLDVVNAKVRVHSTLESVSLLVNSLVSPEQTVVTNSTLNVGELKALDTAFKEEQKCFSVLQRANSVPFEKVFLSDHCLKDTFTLLEKTTPYEYDVNTVALTLDEIYQKFDQILNMIEVNTCTLTKSDLLLLSGQVTTLAKIFDIFGVSITDCQRVEHNFVLLMKQLKEKYDV